MCISMNRHTNTGVVNLTLAKGAVGLSWKKRGRGLRLFSLHDCLPTVLDVTPHHSIIMH